MKCRWVSRSCRTENPRIFPEKGVDMPGKENRFSYLQQASVAQLVEHHLAKVDVESSNLFARSILNSRFESIGSFLLVIDMHTHIFCPFSDFSFFVQGSA